MTFSWYLYYEFAEELLFSHKLSLIITNNYLTILLYSSFSFEKFKIIASEALPQTDEWRKIIFH